MQGAFQGFFVSLKEESPGRNVRDLTIGTGAPIINIERALRQAVGPVMLVNQE